MVWGVNSSSRNPRGINGADWKPERKHPDHGLHVFTNYFNRPAGTDLDFPAVPALGPEPATAS
jgi:hypothetical protein